MTDAMFDMYSTSNYHTRSLLLEQDEIVRGNLNIVLVPTTLLMWSLHHQGSLTAKP